MDPAQTQLVVAVADALPVGLWVAKAPGGELLYANPAFADIMGMAARDDVAVGGYSEPYGIFLHDGKPYPEERLPFVRALQQRATVVVDDLWIHRHDGRKVAVRAVAQPLRDAAGEISSVAIAFFDVTAEVEAVRQRLEAQEWLARVVQQAPVILYAVNADGIVTLCEGMGLATLQMSPGQVVGQRVSSFYPSGSPATENVRRALAGEAFRSKVQVGTQFFESSHSPLRGPDGAPSGYIGVTVNVTEREVLQAKLVESERMASLGTIAASVAHEVNTPLAYVEASLDHLARELPRCAKGPPDPKRMKTLLALLEEARSGAGRVKAIARDLSAFSRPQERVDVVDVRTVLESALRMTSHVALQRARVIRELSGVPLVRANEARLAQVFLNLLLNAAQSLSEGDPSQQEIRVTARQTGTKVEVEVSDTGAGISPEHLPRLFEPFFTTKPAGQGSGLGLSICKNIVTELGGTISVESRPGKTTFRVTLPSAEGKAGLRPSDLPPTLAGRPRVLIVDDDAALRRVLTATLGPACELELAESGHRALELLLGATHYDVVLCDLMMPGMTGMDVYQQLAAARPGRELALVFMTGGAFTAGAREFLSRVPNPCFEKPFDFYAVVAKVWSERAGG
jgi:two-component system cell cycle sensor histidine kinase/response regulator CckA